MEAAYLCNRFLFRKFFHLNVEKNLSPIGHIKGSYHLEAKKRCFHFFSLRFSTSNRSLMTLLTKVNKEISSLLCQ